MPGIDIRASSRTLAMLQIINTFLERFLPSGMVIGRFPSIWRGPRISRCESKG